ncbi:MAG: hypothetical protein IT518_04265 [Burkholderiales bacterium]|nr:hypothetical protein [Burkholderiales bacterium]
MDPAVLRSSLSGWRRYFVAAGLALATLQATAVELRAGPSSYRDAVGRLRPGDTLALEPGIYRLGLDLHGLAGKEGAPITIAGGRGKARSVFVAQRGRNTISIKDAAYVRVLNLDLVGGNVAVDAVKAEGTSKFAHHITIEGLRITGYRASQQNVGISTKCPAWNWIIRANRISRVGTGLYLGDSDGSAPFVRGIVEDNVVSDTSGYALQIKQQNSWPAELAVADGPGVTIIRYNTFAKDATSSTGELARPNVLLGHWPLEGRGSDDRYLVYGNLFLDNPTEALFQAEGNVTLYNNVFVNRFGPGVALREHRDVPRSVDVFHNTIVARDLGVVLRHADPAFRQVVADNAVFAAGVLPQRLTQDNAVHKYEEAAAYLRNPEQMDLAPEAPLHPADGSRTTLARGLPDASLDFDRKPRTTGTSGAYDAGVGARPDRFRLGEVPGR